MLIDHLQQTALDCVVEFFHQPIGLWVIHWGHPMFRAQQVLQLIIDANKFSPLIWNEYFGTPKPFECKVKYKCIIQV